MRFELLYRFYCAQRTFTGMTIRKILVHIFHSHTFTIHVILGRPASKPQKNLQGIVIDDDDDDIKKVTKGGQSRS